jgi:hypothetical protein
MDNSFDQIDLAGFDGFDVFVCSRFACPAEKRLVISKLQVAWILATDRARSTVLCFEHPDNRGTGAHQRIESLQARLAECLALPEGTLWAICPLRSTAALFPADSPVFVEFDALGLPCFGDHAGWERAAERIGVSASALLELRSSLAATPWA